MNLEQRIDFARRERRKAAAYQPEQVPGKGRFGKPTKGTNYLPEKSQYVDALDFYIDRARSGSEPSQSWQQVRFGWTFPGSPLTGRTVGAPETVAEAERWDKRKSHYLRQGFTDAEAARKAWSAQGF